ncbi:hypothetical protein GIB67_026378 [Kingdonia uniflora]|uniref:Uncharacterized protein n=1 Tax=Kingdonia uniflora TaxID=39325 RepID=A0A7J7P6B9_9MAGN|nr:hypothetical protein GIB67_026378 [Kingdonia uniflora]
MAIRDKPRSSSTVSSIRTSEDSVKLFIGGHGKIGFLLGTEKEPAESDLKYAKWFLDDSMEYSQRENNAEIFQLSNEIGNFKQGTQTLGIYYARLRSSWEELSHYDSFIEWPASTPSEKVPILPMTAEIYAKIVEKTRVFQFLPGINPNFEYSQVHLLDRTPFPTLKEAHAYCLSDQSRRSPMPPISKIPSETSNMVVRYAYLAPPLVPSQTSHASSPSLSPLPAASGNSHPPEEEVSLLWIWYHERCVMNRGIEPSPTASIPVTTDDNLHVSHSDDDRMITIRNEKRNVGKPDIYSDTAVYSIIDYSSDHRLSPTYRAFQAFFSLVDIPRTVANALAKPHWKAAILEELHALKINNTWSLVSLPPGRASAGWVGLGARMGYLVSRPPIEDCMTVKPKHLVFDDDEDCNLNDTLMAAMKVDAAKES